MKVFLGGTVAGSKWRDYVMPKLEIDYFNPVVDEWTEEDQKIEIYEREHSDFCLYVVTSKMIGWYSLAEVIDDSFKKSDKTIFCYLPHDEETKFTKTQIRELEQIGKMAEANGAIWKRSLDDVIDYLNSANNLTNDVLLQQTDQINSAFISYGRRHSLAFARKLYKDLTDRGFDIWFDMNDIPLGVDFQEQIDNGIRMADNFIYVMSPHSINSIYCYKELVLALKYNKRIIPILHVEPQDDVTWANIAPEAGKRNWIYLRQDHDTALALSAKTFEIGEKILETHRDDWNFSDDYKAAFDSLVTLMDSHRAFVRTHTILLYKSLEWTKGSRNTHELLVGEERKEAERFLERSHETFKNDTGHLIQPPCTPTDLLAEYIMESKKNGVNLQCDLFICHDLDDGKTVKKIVTALAKYGFSSWISSKDISKGVEYNHAIHNGVIQSSNILFFLSKKSLNSDYCKKEYNFANEYNKRIIPILIDKEASNFENANDFKDLTNTQYIDFTDLTEEIEVEVKDKSDVIADVEARREKTPFEVSLGEVVQTLNHEHTYFEEHRVFLVQALHWKEYGQKQSFLLRGYNFENAKTWLRLNNEDNHYAPLAIHKEYILASEAAKGQLGTDVFISYSRNDSDLARLLNRKLQSAGKTTWFDQESISKGVDFEKEIYKGINGCNNFVFVISPASINSKYCEEEVDYAVTQNKRIITLLAQETDPNTMPEALRVINWIDFKDTDFSEAFSELLQAVELDREHTANHTQLQQRANEWKDHNKIPEFLMNIIACKSAESWLQEAYDKNPKVIYNKYKELKSNKSPSPTELQIKFIEGSRIAIDEAAALEEKKRKRLKKLMILAMCASVIALGLFVFAMFQTKIARVQKDIAETKTKNSTELLKELVPDSVTVLYEHFYMLANMELEYCNFDIVTQYLNNVRLAPDLPDSLKIKIQEEKNNCDTMIVLNNKAIEFYRNFDYKNAKLIYEKILEIIPNDSIILNRIHYCENPVFTKDKFVLIKGGSFTMGSEIGGNREMIHETELSDFYLYKNEISAEDFLEFLIIYGSYNIKNGDFKGESMVDFALFNIVNLQNKVVRLYSEVFNDRPVTGVTWFGANEFCEFWNGSLPSETQWEYAASNGGKDIKYSWGNEIPKGNDTKLYGNICDESVIAYHPTWSFFEGYNDGYSETSNVGSFEPNEIGLYDMTGNVWEWCLDYWSEYTTKPDKQKNPVILTPSQARLMRGGSWRSQFSSCRIAKRSKMAPNYKSTFLGFRYAQNID